MKIIDRWLMRRITWAKPLDSLTLGELFLLQQKVGEAIAKHIEEHNKKVKKHSLEG
jgi:hypothetical protein